MTACDLALIAAGCAAFIALWRLSRAADMPMWETAGRLIVGGAFLAFAAVAYFVIWLVQGFTGRELADD